MADQPFDTEGVIDPATAEEREHCGRRLCQGLSNSTEEVLGVSMSDGTSLAEKPPVPSCSVLNNSGPQARVQVPTSSD